jgi:hypothetical protein
MLIEWLLKEMLSQAFNISPLVSQLRGRPKNRWWNCFQTDINKCKSKNWKERAKKADWENSRDENSMHFFTSPRAVRAPLL